MQLFLEEKREIKKCQHIFHILDDEFKKFLNQVLQLWRTLASKCKLICH